ncbi:MAG TPA: hypothetical protein PLR30_10505, partial [Saprospiraceae bacterium]|nr:hypothetical protein [Saprospiraceae bacterium]
MKSNFLRIFTLFLIPICFAGFIACSDEETAAKPTIISAAGDIQASMDEFRNLLGPNNGNASGSQTTGRREINWDAVPDSAAVPNGYIGDFFNLPTNGLTRGI